MNTKSRFPIALLLLGTLLLASAGSAFAVGRNIIVEFVTFTVSSLNTPVPLDATDTILVRNNGTLFMDDNATIASLTIGDASSAGNVVFTGTAVQSLTVAGNITFGANLLNQLDMTLSTAHTLKVGGSFLASGQGIFRAGAATIEYNSSTPQSVSATVGGTGAIIQYKNLILSGVPATGTAVKTFANGVTVQGTLTISQKAVPSGGFVSYGALATLVYSGGIAQNTTTTEWPASPAALNIPVTINNLSGVTLDTDKTIAAVAPNSLIIQAGSLTDNGKTLTVQGNIANGTGIATELKGAGRLMLSGSGPQTLSGSGTYGNVTLNNAAGATLPSTGGNIRGRLTVVSGKLTLPSSASHTAALLTYGGTDRPAGVYSASTTPTVFDGTGSLNVPVKPIADLAPTGAPPTLTYGTTGVTISGTVSAPPASGFAAYGNGPVDGELVTVYIATAPTAISNIATIVNGAFSATFDPAGLSVGASVNVNFAYPGGINLAARTLSPATTLTVVARPITIIPVNQTKVYGTADPALTYTFNPPDALVGGDYILGSLSRLAGNNVGAYDIIQGTLVITNNSNPLANNNYTVTFDSTKKLTITQKPITVTIENKQKIYGDADPAFTEIATPPLISGDSFSGALTRAPNQQNVGSYPITPGTRTAGPNYAHTFINGNLVIDKRGLSVTFGNIGKIYGKDDPTLTNGMAITGLAGTDRLTGAASRASGETVAGSPYTITAGTLQPSFAAPANHGTASGNYNVTYTTTGNLTITQRLVTVTVASPSKTYGANIPALVTYNTGNKTTDTGFITGSSQNVPTASAPQVPNTITPPSPAVACSLPGAYAYTVNNDALDPNYTFAAATGNPGTLTVNRANLAVTADNKSKVADGNLFDFAAYTSSYNTFVCSDNVANSLTGFLSYGGPAISAVAPGIYQIVPSGLSSPTKYNVSHVAGYLALTAAPGRTDITGDLTWSGGGNAAFMINNPTGSAGNNPGWSLTTLSGALNLTATTGSKFRLDLATLIGNAAGRMPKFDPTRPYSFEFLRATNGISAGTFNPAVFDINTSLFVNPVFGGVFAVRLTGNSLFLDYTPVGSARDATGFVFASPVPVNYNPAPLLADAITSDMDVLSLVPHITTVPPSSNVTINVNVANLKQPIIGADFFINYSSAHFSAADSGPTAPVIQFGGGVWTTVIYKKYNSGGDLDTTVAIQLGAQIGTSADATIAKIILTPTRTTTGTNRVVFRVDGTNNVEQTGVVLTSLRAENQASILPVRVMSGPILIPIDTAGPVLDKATMTATQNQPHGQTGIIVKDGTQANRREVVRTGGSGGTASGPVVITVPSSDAGVGLSGPPVVTLSKSGQTSIVVPCTTPTSTVGPFVYNWNVPAGIDNGTWNVDVTAIDTAGNASNPSGVEFALLVNTREVTGTVELESLKGTNRMVTFKIGDNTGPDAASVRQYDLPLTFTSGPILDAGAYQNRAAIATRLKVPATNDPLSAFLRFGDILNLQSLATKLVNKQGGVSTYIHKLLYGEITQLNLATLANQLANPTRSVDAYVIGRLSSGTIVTLASYQAAALPKPPALISSLTTALLNDFNTIVLGTNIYEATRFASVELSATTEALLATPPPITGATLVELNRNLLFDAYPEYTMGKLRPQTAQRLTQYVGGADSTLAGLLLGDFDTLTLSPAMWPPASPPYGACLYNEQVFLGVTLQSATLALLNTVPFPAGNQLTLLNQRLLEDAYLGIYQRAPLTPATAAAIQAFNAAVVGTIAPFDSAMMTDLNTLINGGVSIYTPARFAPWIGGVDPASELGQLLQNPSPTAAQLIRENRLLLELGYDTELSKSVLAPFRLVQVYATTVEVTAKTGWNLRARKTVSFSPALDATASFVNDGVTGFLAGADSYLRGGDLTGDNVVNLADYNILRPLYGQPAPANANADINGDGRADIDDYSLLQVNFGRTGDADAR